MLGGTPVPTARFGRHIRRRTDEATPTVHWAPALCAELQKELLEMSAGGGGTSIVIIRSFEAALMDLRHRPLYSFLKPNATLFSRDRRHSVSGVFAECHRDEVGKGVAINKFGVTSSLGVLAVPVIQGVRTLGTQRGERDLRYSQPATSRPREVTPYPIFFRLPET